MRSIETAQLKNKRALVRVDFNVPLDEYGKVTDDIRIRGALPTIQYLLDHGASVVLMSHMGRPKGADPALSLEQVVEHLSGLLGRPVQFAGDCIGEKAVEMTRSLQPGEVVILENLRFHPEEKAGDAGFAMQLAKHGDLYVNDAFGTAHRAHASTAVIANFFEEKYAGFLMAKEIENAEMIISKAERPFTVIMGGAKVSDKMGIIQNLLDKIDFLLIGGGMAYTFQKAKGQPIGTSLLEADKIALAASLLKIARKKGVTIITPVDAVVSDRFGEDGKTMIARNENFPADMMGLDIGPETYQHFHQVIMQSKTILWNGPMGVFEMEKFAQGTMAIAQSVVQATEGGAYSLIGGGDSAAAIKKAGLEDKVSYVSTGGGALLEYLEGKELPGVAALG